MGSELTTAHAATATSADAPSPSSAKAIQTGQLFLQRFHRLLRMRASPRLIPSERRLVDRALYSTYWDAVALGLRAEVTAALEAAASEGQQSAAVPT